MITDCVFYHPLYCRLLCEMRHVPDLPLDLSVPETSATASKRNIEFHVNIFFMMVINCIHILLTLITCSKYWCSWRFLDQHDELEDGHNYRTLQFG